MARRGAWKAIIAVMTLAGCAAGPASDGPGDGRASTASELMRAAAIRTAPDAPSFRESALGARPLGAVAAEDITSVGNILLGGASGAAFSLTRERGAQDQYSRIFAWAPADYAPTALEAQRRFWGEIVEAVRASMTDAGDGASIEVRPYGARVLGGTVPAEVLEVRWRTPACDQLHQQSCVFRVARREDALPIEDREPDALGAGASWAFVNGAGALEFRPLGRTTDFPPRTRAVVDELRFYEAISRRLPPWAFIYVAAFSAGFVPAGGAEPRLYSVPIVLNRGAAFYFLEGSREAIPLVRDFGSSG
jgi:hypothetical protein